MPTNPAQVIPAETAAPAAAPDIPPERPSGDWQRALEPQLQALAASRQRWLQTAPAERIAILREIKDALLPVAPAWVRAAARHKGIAAGSPLEGEEWLSGPSAVMNYCNQMAATLARVQGKRHLDGLPVRQLPNGQVAVRVLPGTPWDRLLLNGVRAEVWMQPQVTPQTLARHSAGTYDPASPLHKQGGLALVLGAGNIAAIAPLDVLHKLFCENEVVILKLNPVNDYLIDCLTAALQPLIVRDLLRIVRGGADVGQYLCQHPLVQAIHITGAGASHDAIVWGAGAQGQANKAAGTPLNTRRISSELGAVCPTIVVPGPWSAADIRFQAEQVATQKLHNAGFNCVACQVLVLPRQWPQKDAFLAELERVMAQSEARALYYPGTQERLAQFRANHPDARVLRGAGQAEVLLAALAPDSPALARRTEVFAPALQVVELDGTEPHAYLQAAIDYANTQLYGTLGANIVIHPASIARMGRARFETLLIGLRYGTIAINAWSGLGFLTPQATWGAFPGHTLADVQSGIGVVHNTCLFDLPERTVVQAPFAPFPRNLLSRAWSLLPRPPWFITHRQAAQLGRLLCEFQYRPGLLKLARIAWGAMRG